MLKDILKIAKQQGINYKNGNFRYKNSEVSFINFIRYINSKKFVCGLSNAVKQSKKELFDKNSY